MASEKVLEEAERILVPMDVALPQAATGDDPEFDDGERWNRMVGGRLCKALGFMRDANTLLVSSAMSVALGPLQLVSAWLLAMSQKRESTRLELVLPCPTLDLMLPRRSPIVFVQQYYARVLSASWLSDQLPPLLRQFARASRDRVRLLLHRLLRMIWDCM